MQKGSIVAVNQRRGMFIVEIDSGDHAVFELLSGVDVSTGDRVQGDLEALGHETLRHLGQGRNFNAYGQSGPSSLSVCKSLLGL
ncbi:hypothetical protein ABH945_007208 [Paraburkholderia sp. GAS333]|uniref:hypothetical protein n=1 Tax=Paraburkholderia sp. GAS333 TaxID=3156279 RepID=UPI003D259298